MSYCAYMQREYYILLSLLFISTLGFAYYPSIILQWPRSMQNRLPSCAAGFKVYVSDFRMFDPAVEAFIDAGDGIKSNCNWTP